MKPSACCGTCWHFEVGEENMQEGECYRYPPIAQFSDSFIIAEAPPVDADRRACGEYRPMEGKH